MTKPVRTVPSFMRLGLACALLLGTAGGSPAGPDGASREAFRRPAAIPFPDDDPFTRSKADLGRALFYDTRLSGSETHACASCHDPGKSWSDGLPVAKGEGASALDLRTPTLIDNAFVDRFGWDGKFRDLEAVAFGPILAPTNMNMTEAALIARLKADPMYVSAFAEAFPDKAIDRRNIEMALATFERTIVSGLAPFDRWIAGDEAAIPEPAKRGFRLFNGKARCAECHAGWAFTDGSFHDIGVAPDGDLGRGRFFPSSVKLAHAFKTPTLRDVAKRGPYMHDGSIATLAAVIDLYDKGGIARPSRAEAIAPLGLDAGEKADLLAFLSALSSEDDAEPALAPLAAATKARD